MLEIIVRIVVAGCLMLGSAHLPLNGVQIGLSDPVADAPVRAGPIAGRAL